MTWTTGVRKTATGELCHRSYRCETLILNLCSASGQLVRLASIILRSEGSLPWPIGALD